LSPFSIPYIIHGFGKNEIDFLKNNSEKPKLVVDFGKTEVYNKSIGRR